MERLAVELGERLRADELEELERQGRDTPIRDLAGETIAMIDQLPDPPR